MKKKYLIYIFISATLLIGLWLGLYLGRHNGLPNYMSDNLGNDPTVLNQEKFTMKIPAGWEEAEPPAGSLAMIVNNQEQTTNPAIQKIDFKTYSAVSNESLVGRPLVIFVADYKKALAKALPGIEFTDESPVLVNNHEAYVFEATVTQNQIDFKVLLVIISDAPDKAWVISFNTTADKWDDYRQLFYDTADSFKLK